MTDAASPFPAPETPGASKGLMGSSTSQGALRVLKQELALQRDARISALLARAVAEIRAHRPDGAADLALQALQIDERSGLAWHVLAIAQEGRGDFVTSLRCYEAALALLPADSDVPLNLGRLAFRMGMYSTAEKLFGHFLAQRPDHAEGVNNQALSVSAQDRTDEAIRMLQDFLGRNPNHANIWNSLAGMVAETGDMASAETFYREALRLDPRTPRIRYNLGSMWIDTGRVAEGLGEIETALKRPMAADEKAMMTMARGLAQLALGRLSEGWRNYAARHDIHLKDVTYFAIEGARWTPGATLGGKSLLLVGEQGLGDEVLFAGLVPDVLEDLGSGGELTMAVEKRLAPLFARSFPSVRVEAHRTVATGGRTVRAVPALQTSGARFDLWSPIASLLQDYRPTIDAFPPRTGYLRPDPERVAFWRDALASTPEGPKVGLLWKSAVLTRGRSRLFSSFEAWEPVLRTPGVVFVNLQYGDCEAELRMAQERFGVEIWNPPGINLREDLDDVTALSVALDLVIGFSNASFNLAAAAGTPAWLIAGKGTWTALGTDRYPWYPQVRLHQPETHSDWDPVLKTIADNLAREFGGASGRPEGHEEASA